MSQLQTLRNRYFVMGKHIQRLRKSKGMSQEMLAEQIGYSPHYISHIENGEKKMSFNVIFKMADAMQVKVKDLIPF